MTETEESYENLSIKELQELCKAQGTPCYRTKRDVLIRVLTTGERQSVVPAKSATTAAPKKAAPKKNVPKRKESEGRKSSRLANKKQKINYKE